MTFWEWFKTDGDKLCNFVSLCSTGLLAVSDVPKAWALYCIVGGVIATAAHQSFFPNSPKENQK